MKPRRCEVHIPVGVLAHSNRRRIYRAPAFPTIEARAFGEKLQLFGCQLVHVMLLSKHQPAFVSGLALGAAFVREPIEARDNSELVRELDKTLFKVSLLLGKFRKRPVNSPSRRFRHQLCHQRCGKSSSIRLSGWLGCLVNRSRM